MNKIIKGKRYDTYSARSLGEWDNGCPPEYRDHYKETLYVTKSGNYFIHRENNYGSQYATSPDGGEDIIPLTFYEAKELAEKHLANYEFKEIFGDAEGLLDVAYESSEKITLSLPSNIVKSLKERKETTGANVSWLVAKALRDAGY